MAGRGSDALPSEDAELISAISFVQRAAIAALSKEVDEAVAKMRAVS
jgi:hypothetical protein